MPGHRSSAYKSCLPGSIHAKARITPVSAMPSRSPARRPSGLPRPCAAAWRRCRRLLLRAPRTGLYHNTAVIFDADGQAVGKYRKMHIPDDPLYYEKFYFTPGDLGFASFPTRFGRVGTCVCWDQWYPEAARLTALAGANPLLSDRDRLASQRERRVRRQPAFGLGNHDASHAIANGVFVAAANRTGVEGNCSSGARRSSPTRTATSWPARATTRKRRWSSSATWIRSTWYGRTGPFCAIDAWMRTAIVAGDPD